MVALAATLLAGAVPLVGAPVLAIVLGVALRRLVPSIARLTTGFRVAGRSVLQAAIVVSGFGLSAAAVVRTGVATLPVTLVTVGLALLAAPLLGRALRLSWTLRTLIGVGTAICGASAIAAVASVIEPSEADLALAVATVFTYNVLAVLLFPPLGHAMALSQHQFGVWAGTAINDTSSVVAAGYVYGRTAGGDATIVKLARATLILPITAAIALLHARRGSRSADDSPHRLDWRRIVPWFIVAFLVAALVNSAGLVPPASHPAIAALATLLITVALAGIGLQTPLAALGRAGPAPLALGGLLWALVALSSLAVQRLTGT